MMQFRLNRPLLDCPQGGEGGGGGRGTWRQASAERESRWLRGQEKLGRGVLGERKGL